MSDRLRDPASWTRYMDENAAGTVAVASPAPARAASANAAEQKSDVLGLSGSAVPPGPTGVKTGRQQPAAGHEHSIRFKKRQKKAAAAEKKAAAAAALEAASSSDDEVPPATAARDLIAAAEMAIDQSTRFTKARCAHQLECTFKIANDMRKYHNTCIQELEKRRRATKRKRDMVADSDSQQQRLAKIDATLRQLDLMQSMHSKHARDLQALRNNAKRMRNIFDNED